jgi:thiol:disulfide interchange protein DsbC
MCTHNIGCYLTVKYIISALALILSFNSSAIFAQQSQSVDAAEKQHITAALDKLSKTVGHKLPVTDIKTTPVPGLLEVTSDTNIFYISKDGKYVVSGEMLDLNKDKKSWSLTERTARSLRKKILAGLNVKDMIVFAAKKPKVANVTVFTDIDCHYCEHLQANIKDYTDLGIEIRYLAFPRAGPASASFDKAISVWCSTNRQENYDLATKHKDIPKNLCKNNLVEDQFELGKRMGVNGTPTMFLDNGYKIGGLLEAKDLLKLIKEEGN